MYSGLTFFISAIALSLLFFAIRRLLNSQASSWFLGLVAFSASCFFYKNFLFEVVCLYVFFYYIIRLNEQGCLKRWMSICLILLPLILAKTHSISFFGIIGLSFITFRTIDALLYASASEKTYPIKFFIYVFFPLTLLAGPMYRWRDYVKDLSSLKETANSSFFFAGAEILILGIIQKFLFADFVQNSLLNSIAQTKENFIFYIYEALFYAIFLYFDFAGYSNMAVGIGRMFGLNIPVNFRSPILAKNPMEFWKRWHISLSEWLRDVVFMPVYSFLSRTFLKNHRLACQNVAISLTLIIMGVWNGLELHYFLSGAIFALSASCYNGIMFLSKDSRFFHFLTTNYYCNAFGRILNLFVIVFSLYVFSGRLIG